MKDTDKLYKTLQELNPFEEIGRRHFDTHGRGLSVEQLGYLLYHSHSDHLFERLESPEALTEQKQFKENLHRYNGDRGLSAQLYLPEGKDFEMEQLLRYVNIPRHKHDFVELVCILSGQCEHIINGEHYVNHAGDFTVIPPAIDHELHASPDCVCLTTKIRDSAFVEMFSDILLENSVLAAYFTQTVNEPFYRCVLALHCGDDCYIKETMLRLYMQQMEQKLYSDKIMHGLWNVLLAYMLQNYQDTASLLVYDVVEHEEMLRVLAYIYQNYQAITLTATAAHFHFSVPYLSSKIHRITGHTFSEHVKNYKLQRGAELLLNTDKKLEQICEQIGYVDTAQFIRSFKNVYGTTPIKYRKMFRTPHENFNS